MKKVLFLLFFSAVAFVSCQKEEKATLDSQLASIDLTDDSFSTPHVKDGILWFKTKKDALNFYLHLQKQLDVAEYSDLAEDESSEERFLLLVDQKLGFNSLLMHQMNGVNSRSDEEFIGDNLEKALLNPDYAVGVGSIISVFHKEEAYEVLSADTETLAEVYATPVDEQLPLGKFNGNIKLTHSESGRNVITGGPDVLWPPIVVTDRSAPSIEIGAVDLCGDPFEWYISVDWGNIFNIQVDWGDGTEFSTITGDVYSSGNVLTHSYDVNSNPDHITVTVYGYNPSKTYSQDMDVNIDEACFNGWRYDNVTESLGNWSLQGEIWARKNLFGNRCGSTITSRKNGDKERRTKEMQIFGTWRFSDDFHLCGVDKVDNNYWKKKKRTKTHYIFNIGGSPKHITDDVHAFYEMDVPDGTIHLDLALWYCQ